MSEDIRLLFMRYGPIPESGRSKNHLSGEEEAGVSVYEAVRRGDGRIQILVPSMSYGVHVTLSGFVGHAAFVVDGDVVGHGSEGEPLLANCRVLYEVDPIVLIVGRAPG